MIAAWMTLAIIVGTVIAIAATLLDRAAQLARIPSRWVWAGALALTIGAVAFAPGRTAAPQWKIRVDSVRTVESVSAARVEQDGSLRAALRELPRLVAGPIERAVRAGQAMVPEAMDGWLAVAWLALSAGAFVLLLTVLARFRRARATWPRTELHGSVVRVAPDGGPAVIGLTRPEVVVPRWLLGCSAEEQRLVLAHELEHVRARDHLLLIAGCFSLALMPWHPAVWWMLSRLRLAVELDCDRRVLRRGAPLHSYGSLLIDLAGRCTGLPVGAPALADESSHLEQRLLAMKPTSIRFASLRGASQAAIALVTLVAACEARLPTAPEVENMDVARAEAQARKSLLLKADSGNVFYMVDGVVSSAKVARALTPEQIAMIEVQRGAEPEQSSVSITTRDFIKANGMPGDSARDHLRIRTPEPSAQKVQMRFNGTGSRPMIRTFDGVIVLDGNIVSEDAMAKLDPATILSVEIIKGDAAAKLYPSSPEAAKGVIKITTR